MAGSDEAVRVQLATRIPKTLHRNLKLHCVNAETSVMDFVTKAITEKLGASGGGSTRKTRGRGR
jgi:predicted HicB family RNase H-like nuclease